MKQMQLLFPGGKTHALTLSYDDAVEQDIRLMELIETYGVKATFNLDTGCFTPEGTVFPPEVIRRRLTREACKKLYNRPCCEAAAHTLTHAQLNALPEAVAVQEVLMDRLALEEMFDCPVRGLVYPMGRTSQRVMEMMSGLGILYARGSQATHSFTLPENWMNWQPTCRHADPELMQVADEFLNAKMVYDGPLVFMLMGHAYEFDEQNNWHVIEEFLKKMHDRDDIWYATCLDIAKAYQRFKRLECSANGKKIANPSFEEVWVRIDGKAYRIAGGETLKL